MCQFPSCNLFTQHYIVLWRDTSSKLWTPVLLFNHAIQSTSCFPVFLLQTILFPLDTINSLFSARPVRLTTSLSSWGRVIWLCCAGLYFNLGVILSPIGSITLVSYRGKFLLLSTSSPSSWGAQHQKRHEVPLLLPFGLLESSGVKLRKIVSFSNSENIYLPVILKPKTVENRNWPLWHLVNRLVAGNQ